MNPNIAWGVLLLSCLAYEVYALVDGKPGDTLSARTRAWFHTLKGRTGKAIFTVSWLLLTAWFIPHIIFGGPGL